MVSPLFTFIIASYNNFKYIFEAIDSVLKQSYDNIQLIVSNDGSNDFNREQVDAYIKKNNRGNITSYIVNNNEKNIGTVAHIELCRKMVQGEYIMYMAADDSLYDSNVIKTFVDEFERLGKDALCISSKVAMCSEDLDDIVEVYPDSSIVECIRNYTSIQMFSRLCHTFTIPTTSTCYRKTLYEIVGPYDNSYYIIEDAPLYLKMTRMGIKIHWLDIIAARHRDGGISHGNNLGLSEAFRKYRQDELEVYRKEILPYKNLILDSDIQLMEKKWQYLQYAYWRDFERKNYTNLKTIKYCLVNFAWITKDLLKKITLNDRVLMHMVSLCIISLSIAFLNNFNQALSNKTNTTCAYMVYYSVFVICFIYLVRILYKLKKWGGF